MRVFLAFSSLLLLATPAQAAIPDPIRTMLDAAIASGNDGEIGTIAKFAKQASPESAPEIDSLVTDYRARKTAAAEAELRNAGAFDRWDGQGDLGGFRSTGSSNALGLSAGIYLHRDGIDWGHKIRARVDYQETEGLATREALIFSYEPRYKIDDRLFTYGLAQYERDPFLGFNRRFSLSSGVGYRVIDKRGLLVDLDAGPAFRSVRFVTGDEDETLAGRASIGIQWTLSPKVKFINDTDAFVESSNSTLSANNALDAKIIGSLSARLSYNVRYESNPPLGGDNFDTMSRASLVYDF